MTDVSPDPTSHADGLARKGHKRTLSRAVTLLDAVLWSNAVPLDEVAESLMVQPNCIVDYRSGARAMPIEVQLLLVALTIERVPTLRRSAHQLRAQIKATLVYASGQTVTHAHAMPERR